MEKQTKNLVDLNETVSKESRVCVTIEDKEILE